MNAVAAAVLIGAMTIAAATYLRPTEFDACIAANVKYYSEQRSQDPFGVAVFACKPQ